MFELTLELPEGPGRRAAIETALRQAILDGRLRSGVAVPSSRVLAADLGVGRSTVVAAYEQLTAEGFLTSRQGRGTVVASVPLVEDDTPAEPDVLGPTPAWDLRPGEPAVGSFPVRAWLASIRRAFAAHPDALAYGDPRGRPELRAALSAHLGRTRGVVTTAAGVMVTSGFASGLGFLADLFRRRGVERVAVEEAALPMHRMVLRVAGLAVDTIPVDAEGIDVDALAQSRAQAVVVTPANQYPYGFTMSPTRRADLVAWAESRGSWIVEDDYDGEFRYDRRPIGGLQALAAHRVIYIGTTSKTMGAGLRLGWLVVPPELREDLVVATNVRNGAPVPDQLALADFIERGELDRHTRAMRRLYGERRERLLRCLAAHAPWVEPTASDAGLHLCLPLPPEIAEARVLVHAERLDLGVLGLCAFHRAPADRQGVVVGFSRPADHAYGGCLDRLATVLDAVSP